jgi:hypothetical protein
VHGNCVMAQINPVIYINVRANMYVCGGGELKTLLTFIFVFVCVSSLFSSIYDSK